MYYFKSNKIVKHIIIFWLGWEVKFIYLLCIITEQKNLFLLVVFLFLL